MVTAFILATTKTGKEREVLNDLREIGEIKEVHNVYGDYDVFIKAESCSLDSLNEFLVRRIRNIPNIMVTTTMIGL
ncbi:MAG: Lrp/AsnC ligand binding domain-containing protein [archaeon]|jgi:DNA-binding Lrp family transcriptional regulator|nr:AsnC family transcriptional regulator [Euryarchaeota archaeon]MDP6704474.1 Lrp/AsnC ligand binding domain-containing protein [archaeon]HIK01048.1 Lrp/AsnC ligand binding domain-containing protein [Candidatus Undinarchaeales archaeon ERR594346 U_76725]|tara:strand:- start:55327 stop:55554 length:228 start_codon:yes stop_codon:yes gene_type:complete